MHQVVIRPTALDELEKHTEYLHEHASPRVAERFVTMVQKSIQQLASMPSLGSSLHSRRLLLTGLHYWLVKKPFQKYVVYYRFDDANVEIIHILHGARNAEELMAL